MKIGLDYEGVVSCSPGEWSVMINECVEHEFYLVSHCVAKWDYAKRVGFCAMCDDGRIVNLSFIHDPGDEGYVREGKGRLVREYGIELFIDDSRERCDVVVGMNPDCIVFCIAPENFRRGIELIRGL